MRRAIAGILLAAAAAACGGSAQPEPGTPSAAPTTGTTAARPSAPSRPPSPTARPVTVDAPCPYADAETVAGTVGQRITRTTVTRTRPYPGCAFHRPNGEKAVDIAVSVLAGPVEAQARALALAGPAANPVDDAGDGGAVAITDGGALLGVSRGATLVVVRINQRSSLEAVEIAKLVLAGL